MGSAPTWRSVSREAASLCTTDEEILELIGRLPLVPVSQLVPLSAVRSRRTVYACVARLADRGLVCTIRGPADAGRPRRKLLLLSNLGLAGLAWSRDVDPTSLARAWGLQRASLRALVGELPSLLSSYTLLAHLAATGHRGVRLWNWTRPWRWRGGSRASRPVRGVTLPAYAAIAWEKPSGESLEGNYLLVADTGGLSPAALRPQLVRLARTGWTRELTVPTVVIATTSPRRVEAWWALLEALTLSDRNAGVVQAEVATWESWAARAGTNQCGGVHDHRAPLTPLPPGGLKRNGERWLWASVPRPINLGEVAAGVREWDLPPRDRAALDIIGRHPFLSAGALADVLGRHHGWARARRAELLRLGLARVLLPEETPLEPRGVRDLIELTIEGLGRLTGYLGLSLAAAVRHHGLAGGGPVTPVGPRRALLAHLAHTLGADAVFTAIARSARSQSRGSLLEWRNAAACTHGRTRPDGYGLLCLGQSEYGFFLEFDRGTVRPRALRAKFAAYHRYRVSSRAARDYDGFPAILVVTIGPGAEERIAEAVRAANVGQPTPLPIALTTVGLLEAHIQGALGSIWRDPESRRRRSWPTPNGGTHGIHL